MFNTSSSKGFTLAELIVSMGIMLTITTLIAFNQSHYTSDAELKNLANDLGLSLRQAQVYGISVKEFVPGSQEFNVGYGVEFNKAAENPEKAYVFFADRGVKNSVYDGEWTCLIGGDSECLDKTTLSSTNYVSKLCRIYSSGEDHACNAERLDITFIRPETEANIIFDAIPDSQIRGARIELSSEDGKTHSVVVYTTGQISVQ